MTRILSLDDDSSMLELINLILQRAGYDHLPASNSFEALNILRNEPIDLFTQDIMRPNIDGWEFCRLMKSEEILRDTPVLIITCQTHSIDKIMGEYPSIIADSLTKPFGPQDLVDSVEAVLKKQSKPLATEQDRQRARIRREMALLQRAQLLKEVVANLANAKLTGNAVVIEGFYGRYEISLSTGHVIRKPSQRICIVPEGGREVCPDSCLPFEDIDVHTEQIISTVLMLSNDSQIRDETILHQLIKEQSNDYVQGRGRDQNPGRAAGRARAIGAGIPAGGND